MIDCTYAACARRPGPGLRMMKFRGDRTTSPRCCRYFSPLVANGKGTYVASEKDKKTKIKASVIVIIPKLHALSLVSFRVSQ